MSERHSRCGCICIHSLSLSLSLCLGEARLAPCFSCCPQGPGPEGTNRSPILGVPLDGTDGLGLPFLLAVFSLGFQGPPGLLLQLPKHPSCPLRIADGQCADAPVTSSLDIRLVIRWNHAAAALAAMDGGQDVVKQKNAFWQRGLLLVKTGHVEVGVQFSASTEALASSLGD